MATVADFSRIGNYARMYNPSQNIDRSQCTRLVPMEVLSLGYSRTGTLSMQRALEILGYPNPYHFSSFYDNVLECDMWVQAMKAKYHGIGTMPDKAFFDGLLGHVGATTDAPCNAFAKELVEFYPEAKVVLVERELENWYASWMAFCENAYSPIFPILARLDPWWGGRIVSVGVLITDIQAGFSSTKDQARVRSKDAYRRHYAEVREIVPKERLLNFSLKEGWAPLCEFLGKEVPDVPFPHLNDKEANSQGFAELGQLMIKQILKNALVGATFVGAPLAAWYWYGYR